MATEFDILGGFVSQDAIKEFGDLGKAIDKSAESAAALLKSLEGIKAKQDYSKQAAKLAEINTKMEGQVATLNAKLEAREKEHQMKLESAKAAHLASLERQEKAYQDKLALIITAQERNTEAAATAHANKLETINQKKADRAIAQAERQAKATAAALDRENAKAFKSSPEGVSQTVGLQAQAQVMKLNAVIASEYTSSLQKLDAQIKLNVIDAQKFVAVSDTQNPKYLELIGSTKKLSAEYDRMAKAAGANMTKTNSMYGATFSLTQVMRELPNFAIDARIGFMALSNNLPMLAENFQRVTKEIDAITGKEKGFKGAMKEFGKSLLSLNTIMIILTTAMVLFGDDITKFISKMFKGADATDKFTLSQKAMIKVLGEQSGLAQTNTSKILELGVAIDKYKQGTGNAKKIVEQYNETLGVHYGKLNSINEVMAAYPEQASNYIMWSIKMAAAMLQVDEAAKLALELQKVNETLKATYSQENIKKVETLNKQLKESAEGKDTKTGMLIQTKLSAEMQKRAKEEIANYYNINSQILKRLDLQSKLDKTLKSATELYPGDFSSKSETSAGGAKRTFTEILVMQEFYNQERAKLVEKMAALEDDITKSRLTGELNNYEQRKKAAELYYKTTKSLAEIDRDVAIATANEKLAHEKKVIKDKYDDNVRKFGGNSAEAQKSETELNTGNATLERNNVLDILKITDEFNKKILDGSRKQASQLYTIQQDMYADEVYLLEQAQAKKLAALGIADAKQKQKTSAKSLFGQASNALGLKTSAKSQEAEDAQLSANQVLDIEEQGLMARLMARDKFTQKLLVSGKEEEEIYRKLGEIRAKREVNSEKSVAEAIIDLQQIAEDARAEMVSKSIDTLKTLWDEYYQYQADKIDANLERQTKINEESIKQYEDETDAGKHSAKDLSDFKDRTAAYQASQDEEAARRKKELEKEQFLTTQAFALGQVWIQYALTQGAIATAAAVIAATPGLGLALSTLYAAKASAANLGSAIAGTALIAAQTIPAFAEGGTMGKDGKALIGDGGKNELIMTPTGDWYVSPKVPTVVDMQAGTKIFPDINKLDLNSFLAMAQVQPQMLKTDNLEKEIKGLRQDVRNQKQGNFYGMPLIRQLNNSSRYSARKRGLMN